MDFPFKIWHPFFIFCGGGGLAFVGESELAGWAAIDDGLQKAFGEDDDVLNVVFGLLPWGYPPPTMPVK